MSKKVPKHLVDREVIVAGHRESPIDDKTPADALARHGLPLSGMDYVRLLAANWKERATHLGLFGPDRDNRCLDFFLGAAALASEEHGMQHATTIALLKVSTYVIALRGERGLEEHLNPPRPGRIKPGRSKIKPGRAKVVPGRVGFIVDIPEEESLPPPIDAAARKASVQRGRRRR